MGVLFQALQTIAALAAIVCYILVVVKMFQNGKAALGIVTLVLTFCTCGIGGLIAFIYGWMKATEWNLKNVMLIWTAAIIVAFVTGLMGGPIVDPAPYLQQFQPPVPQP